MTRKQQFHGFEGGRCSEIIILRSLAAPYCIFTTIPIKSSAISIWLDDCVFLGQPTTGMNKCCGPHINCKTSKDSPFAFTVGAGSYVVSVNLAAHLLRIAWVLYLAHLFPCLCKQI